MRLVYVDSDNKETLICQKPSVRLNMPDAPERLTQRAAARFGAPRHGRHRRRPDMAELFGERRKHLLRQLLRNKAGATIDELSQAIGVTRTAVRQHLAALLRDGLVAPGDVRPSGGRPNRLYVLTDAGKEAFPRHYSWFAQLLVEAIADEHGVAGLRTRLGRIASGVVAPLRPRAPDTATPRQQVAALSELMDELGYDAHVVKDSGGMPTIEADNCVFHELALRNREVCNFDLALMSGFTGQRVELHECMARGGQVCRFRFMPRGDRASVATPTAALRSVRRRSPPP
jgi:predicted ArsR family transcriptional regulator